MELASKMLDDALGYRTLLMLTSNCKREKCSQFTKATPISACLWVVCEIKGNLVQSDRGGILI